MNWLRVLDIHKRRGDPRRHSAPHDRTDTSADGTADSTGADIRGGNCQPLVYSGVCVHSATYCRACICTCPRACTNHSRIPPPVTAPALLPVPALTPAPASTAAPSPAPAPTATPAPWMSPFAPIYDRVVRELGQERDVRVLGCTRGETRTMRDMARNKDNQIDLLS